MKEKKTKTEFLHIRIDSDLKRKLEEVAKEEHRTLSNLVEYLIKEYVES